MLNVGSLDISFTVYHFVFQYPSVPSLNCPLKTCKEIKASEGGQAVSGEYWFDSIIPGETVLAHCDMKNEGKLKGKGEVRNLKTSLKSLGYLW